MIVSDHLCTFLQLIREHLKFSLQIQEECLSNDKQEFIQLCIKIFLQIIQKISNKIQQHLWNSDTGNREAKSLIQDVIQLDIEVLDSASIYIETRQRAATVFAYIITLNHREAALSSDFQTLLQSYTNSETVEFSTITIPRSESSLLKKDFEHAQLLLIHAILSCFPNEKFLDKLTSQETEVASATVAQLLFDFTYKHCCKTNHPYHAFKTVLLWWQKFMNTFKVAGLATIYGDMVRKCSELSLPLVWVNLDNPVDGVTELVIEMFEVLVYCVTVSEYKGSQDLISHITGHVMQMSWQVKGKYSLCAILLPHIDLITFLESYCDTWPQMLECMSMNFMASPATVLFKAISLQAQKEDKWSDICLEWVIKGITNSNSQTLYNVCSLWLPFTLKKIPNSYQVVMNCLKTKKEKQLSENILRANMAVYKTSRKLNIIDLSDVPEKTVRQCLLHTLDDIRLDAFSLVCNSPKKSAYLSEKEIVLLKQSLPHAMTSDSPSFRQQLQAHISSLVVRARDGALFCLRNIQGKKRGHEKTDESDEIKASPKQKAELDFSSILDKQIDLVVWLWDLCTEYLNPSCSFQRLKTCLEWMWAILNCIVFQASKKKHRKGGCTELGGKFLLYAEEEKNLQLFNKQTVHSLLSCLQDGTDDVRELSCAILLEFCVFPLPLTSDDNDQNHAVCELLHYALSECLQPRAHDANAGALICKLIFIRYVVQNSWVFKEDSNGRIQLGDSNDQNIDPCLSFMELLLKQLSSTLKVANQSDILKVSQTNSTHGILVAIQYCVSNVVIKHQSQWKCFVSELLSTTHSLVNQALHILGGKVQQDGSLPSFEEMGLSIQSVIEDSIGDEYDNDGVVLSSQHQLLMTWAWLNIRETSILYGKLVSLPMSDGNMNDDSCVVTLDQVKRMADVLMKILMGCRHRGAIEGSSAGLIEFSYVLLMSSYKDLENIPRDLVDVVLDHILKSSGSSITRRSAGLPLVIQAILCSEAKTKQNAILQYSIRKLLEIATSLPSEDTDQKLDLPQVHALNILKVLVAEASLASSLLPFTEDICMLAVNALSSPVWAVRNSGTQLFSALLNRMFGQKKTKDDSLHTLTAFEFFTHFPKLEPFLLDHLVKATSIENRNNLSPVLFPILAILSKLTSGVSELDSGYIEAVQLLSSSPIYAIRELSAKALVPLVPVGNLEQYILELALDLPVTETACQSYNKLHGCILQIDALLVSANQRQEEGNLEEHLQQVLEERKWICSKINQCHIVKSACLQLLQKCSNSAVDVENMAKELISVQHINISDKVGGWQYLSTVINQWLLSCEEEEFCYRLSACLNSSCVDVQLISLCALKMKLNKKEVHFASVVRMQEMLLSFIHKGLFRELLCVCLDCTIDVFAMESREDGNEEFGVTERIIWESNLIQTIISSENTLTAALALTVLSSLLKQQSTFTTHITDWVSMLSKSCKPEKSEVIRTSAAKSLTIAGSHILNLLLFEDERTTNYELLAFRLLKSAAILLLDDDSEVRNKAASFVGNIPWLPNRCLQGDIYPTYAMALLFSYGFTELVDSPVCMKQLFLWMLPEYGVEKVLENYITRNEDIFEAQKVNLYGESHIVFSHILIFIQSNCDKLTTSAFPSSMCDLENDLNTCFHFLTVHCGDLMNMTGKSVVFESIQNVLYRILAQCSVYRSDNNCDNLSSTVTSSITNISANLSKIIKMKGTPPGLTRLVEMAKNLCSSLSLKN